MAAMKEEIDSPPRSNGSKKGIPRAIRAPTGVVSNKKIDSTDAKGEMQSSDARRIAPRAPIRPRDKRSDADAAQRSINPNARIEKAPTWNVIGRLDVIFVDDGFAIFVRLVIGDILFDRRFV